MCGMGLILNRLFRSLSESSWLSGLENSSVSLVAGSWDGPEDGELNIVVSEEVRFGSSDVVFLAKNSGSDDGDGVSGGSVVTSHFHMKLTDSTVKGDVSVLFIHVVDSSSGLISEDDAESFDVVGSFFVDFVDGEDLALSSLGLELPSKVIPEFRFSNDFVGSEKSQSIDFGVRFLFSRNFSTED